MAKTRKQSETVREDASPGEPGGTAEANRRARQRIAARAYEMFLARGGGDGRDFDDWIAAEREVSGSAEGTGSDRSE